MKTAVATAVLCLLQAILVLSSSILRSSKVSLSKTFIRSRAYGSISHSEIVLSMAASNTPKPPYEFKNATSALGTAASGSVVSTGFAASPRRAQITGPSVFYKSLASSRPTLSTTAHNDSMTPTSYTAIGSSDEPSAPSPATSASILLDVPSTVADLRGQFPDETGSAGEYPEPTSSSDDPSQQADSGEDSPQSTATSQSSPSASENSSVFIATWNPRNVSCYEYQLGVQENATATWIEVDGNGTLATFDEWYVKNLIVCPECYGMDNTTCQSTNPLCQHGLREFSNGTTNRYDVAASIFTQTGSGVACDIDGSNPCQVAPVCDDMHGPAGTAIMISLTNMHNSLSNVYNALQEARASATDQMENFKKYFAPVPSMKKKSIWMEIMFVIAGLVAGLLPGIGEAVAPAMMVGAASASSLMAASVSSLMVGVGSAVVMNDMIYNQPTGDDPSSALDSITGNLCGAYSDVADSLFANGSYSYATGNGQETKTQSWADVMADGALLQQEVNTTDALQQVYERILYQQLAVYTWKNLETDGAHIPFIAFDTQPCGQQSPDGSALETVIPGVNSSDTNITYNGNCYYLLDGTTKSADYGQKSCSPKPLPGGTNKVMTDNSASFANLTLADFIIPSVNGWGNHSYQDGYESMAQKGALFTDPQAQGVVSLPVCDYIKTPLSPGVNCPKIGSQSKSKSCEIFPPSTGTNQAGQFVDGSCGIHIQQWQKKEGDENPSGTYQLSVTVLDGAGRPVGAATKQTAAESLEIVDSVLPYDLVVATGNVDSAPILFWYSDQYWNSSSTGTGNNTNHCAVGAYDSGSRQMDCGFSCPLPDPTADPPVSATVDNPFPNTPVPAVGGDITFTNTFITSRSATPTASTVPYPTGRCGVHITQYQKNEGAASVDNTTNYKVEVTLKGSDMKPIAAPQALQPAPSGQPISIPGLSSPFTVTAGGLDSDPLTISFAGETWKTNSPGRTCSVSGFKGGSRDLDCRFDCG